MIIIDIDKAKDIAHEKRRAARAEEFKPHDEVIMKQIPGNDMAEAETARQAIREKYETIQVDIESAEDVVELKQILDTMSE
jgi:hypothetical protein